MDAMAKARSWSEVEVAGGVGGSQGARRATGEPPTPPAPQPAVLVRLETEVGPKPQRRTFTTEYKLRILEQADGCKRPGEVGALLRREGLYSSHLVKWRRLRASGELGKKRGRPADADRELKLQLQKVERENRRLQRKLRQTEIVIEVQKKLSEILGINLPEPPASDENDG
jgi:transposase